MGFGSFCLGISHLVLYPFLNVAKQGIKKRQKYLYFYGNWGRTCELQGKGGRTGTRVKPTCMLLEARSVPAPHPARSLHRRPSPCLVVFKCCGHRPPIRQLCFSHARDAVNRHIVLIRFSQLERAKNKTFQEFQLLAAAACYC